MGKALKMFEDKIDNILINLIVDFSELVDTPGQSEYSRLRALSYRDANIFLICYAIDDEVSYGNVSSFWVPELKHYKVYGPVDIRLYLKSVGSPSILFSIIPFFN